MSRFLSARLQGLEPYVPGEQPKNMGELIKLNTNESPYPPSPAVLDAITRQQVADLRLYPDTTAAALRQAVADRYGIGADCVICGNGSDEILSLAFQAFCLGGAARFADITYGFYKVWADLYGVVKHPMPLREDFTLDPTDYWTADETCFIANPNAPTGIALPVKDIEEILRRNPDNVVVVDEAYVDFGGESVVPLITKYPNLLVVQTFSKSRSLAGGRLGLGIGCPDLIDDLNRVRGSFHPYNLNRLSILAGAAAMKDGEYFEKTRTAIIETREKTRAALLEMGCTVTKSCTNFLFVKLPGVDGKTCLEKLRAQNILVRWWNSPRISDYTRVTIGTPQQMERYLEAVASIIKEAQV